jgi:hypothetical protein
MLPNFLIIRHPIPSIIKWFFQQNGLYAAQYNIFFLTKAQEAKGKGQKPSKIIEKISWEDYQYENPTQAKGVIIAHPPPKNNRDTTKYAQTNYYSQRERFVKWLRTGSGKSLYIHTFLTSSFESDLSLTLFTSFTGYQKKFADDIHLVESGVGNYKGNCQGGGDSPGLATVGSESVLGDHDNNNNNSGYKNNNGRGKAQGQAQGEDFMGSDADIESLSERLGNLDMDFENVAELENDEMHVLSVLLKDVHVRGELVDTRDVYVIQYTIAPGLVWDSVNVEVDREDGNLVRFQGDMHFNLSDGWNRIKNDWKTAEGMTWPNELQHRLIILPVNNVFQTRRLFIVTITQTDKWPDGGNSRPEIVDPFKLHLRSRPTRHGTSFLETGKVKLMGVMLIPQVRPAHKYPNPPWETIQPPGGYNAECMYPHKVYTAECDKSLTATYQCKTPIPSNILLVTNILTNN